MSMQQEVSQILANISNTIANLVKQLIIVHYWPFLR